MRIGKDWAIKLDDNSSFTLSDDDTETDTEVDTMCVEPKTNLHRFLSEQNKHFHTILHNIFLSISVLVSVSVTVNTL